MPTASRYAGAGRVARFFDEACNQNEIARQFVRERRRRRPLPPVLQTGGKHCRAKSHHQLFRLINIINTTPINNPPPRMATIGKGANRSSNASIP